MGFKNFFVEEIPVPVEFDPVECVESEETVDVNVEDVEIDNLLDDIYKDNNLSDLSKSIFKVEELINSLPAEMPNDTKKTTVLSILSSFGLNAEIVINDANERLSVITGAKNKIKEENQKIITDNEEIIETKKHEIQNIESDNAYRINIINDTNQKISSEEERINKLIKFIE